MKISSELRQFLEAPIVQEFINNNNWEEVYYSVLHNLTTKRISDFTLLLLEAGINPLKYLNFVPEYYLYDANIVDFNIPENIEGIESWAFACCSKLKSINLPNNIKEISFGVFFDCPLLKDIYYNGTKEEWKRIEINNSSGLQKLEESLTIHCNDGDIEYEN